MLNVAEYVLEWARAFFAVAYFPLRLPFIAFLEPYQRVVPSLLIAHLGLFATLVAVRAVAFAVPDITEQEHGLLMQTRLGRRWIPYSALRGMRSVELQKDGRFVVWVHSTRGLPLQNWVASLLFGRLLWRGFMITSDLAGFDQLVGRIVSELHVKYGEEGFAAHFSEEPPTRLMTMLSAPAATVHQIATSEEIRITQAESTWMMISAASSLAVPSLIGSLIHLQIPWGIFILPLLGLLEWPLASLYLSAVPLGETERMSFEAAMRVYPITQLPRWAVAIALTLLVAGGAPLVLLLLVVLPGVGLGCWTVLLLTQDWFHVKMPEALLGMIVTLIFQLVLFEVFLAILARS